MKAMCGLSLAMAAGCLTSGVSLGADTPAKMVSNRTMKAWPVANIYYNIKTGERIATPFASHPRNASSPLWLATNTDPCGTGGTVGIIDNPDADGDGLGDIVFTTPTVCTAMPTVPCEGSWNGWIGDVPADSVVDCVVLAYGIIAPDTDTDLDSIGDGIVGYNLIVTWSDNDNGFGADLPLASGRSCILDLTLSTIPGALPGLPPGYVAVYTLTLDFASLAPSLIFELGDSDGVDDTTGGTGISGGAEYGHPTFGDLDGDGLNDFSFSIRFDQSALPVPGAGAGASKGANGALMVAPVGCTAAPCSTPTDPPGSDGDLVDVYTSGPSCPPTITSYVGTFFFGGFNCATGTPNSQSYLEMYGPNGPSCAEVPSGSCSVADLAAPVGTLNFDDVVAFLVSFGANGCGSDLADPIGTWNFDDVVAFLVAFGAGCP
ncbi:MAG: hypothetical protein R3B57_08265 [Phycisphaerales bacterium]